LVAKARLQVYNDGLIFFQIYKTFMNKTWGGSVHQVFKKKTRSLFTWVNLVG